MDSPNCISPSSKSIVSVEIFIDGGLKPNKFDETIVNTWGIAVIANYDPYTQALLFTQFGHFDFDPGGHDYIGQKLPSSSFVPGLYAQTMARLFVLQHAHKFIPSDTPICFVFDNMSADHVASNHSISKAQPNLSKFAIAIATHVANNFCVTSRHTKSHQGDPWNELADSLCNFANKRKFPTFLPYSLLSQSQLDALEWHIALQQYQVSEQLLSNDYLSGVTPLVGTDPYTIAATIDSDTGIDDSFYINNPITIAQYNVCSIALAHNRQTLVYNFVALKLAVSCFQETRTKLCGKYNDKASITCCHSPAIDGHGGCEIWINHKIPWSHCDGKQVCVSHDMITVTHADHRLLIVCIKVHRVVVFVVSAHAPHTETEKASWWNTFYCRMESLYKTSQHVIVGVDTNNEFTNSYVGPASFVGNIVANKDCTDIQKHVVDVICDAKLSVPTTIEKYVDDNFASDPTTHTTPDSYHQSAIDHFFTSQTVQVSEHSISKGRVAILKVVHKQKSLLAFQDHEPISMKVSLLGYHHVQCDKRRTLTFDRSKIGRPKNDQQFINNIAEFTPVPYHVDTITHCHIIDSFVRNAASEAYPKDRHEVKNSFLSSMTIGFIRDRNRKLYQVRAMLKKFKALRKYVVLQAWKSTVVMQCVHKFKYHCVFGFASFKFIRDICHRFQIIHDLTQQIKSCVELEREVATEEAAEQTIKAIQYGTSKELHSATKKLKLRNTTSARKVFRVADSQGTPVPTIEHEKRIFREHFSAQLQGNEKPFSLLIYENWDLLQHKVLPDKLFNINHPYVISFLQISTSMSKAKSGKAAGENAVSNDLLRTFPYMFSCLLLPVYVKSVTRLDPPLQWKGGVLVELFKNKGVSSDKNNYRDILLGDNSGKHISSVIRNNLLPAAQHHCGQNQFGSGLNGGETAFAHLYIRLISEYFKAVSKSSAILFVDVTTAFAVLLRRIIFDPEENDEKWLFSFRAAGFNDEDIEYIYTTVTSTYHLKSFEQHHSDKQTHLFACMNSSYTNTWFSQDYIPSVVHTSRGCQAGMPLADLMYAVSFSRVLLHLKHALKCNDLVPSICIQNQCLECEEVVYADDLAIPIATSADKLVSSTTDVARIAILTFAMFGMQVNLHKEKLKLCTSFEVPILSIIIGSSFCRNTKPLSKTMMFCSPSSLSNLINISAPIFVFRLI